MSSSAINAQLFQAKIGSIQNQADSSSVYSNGQWSFKNSTALTSVTISDSGNVGVGATTTSAKLTIKNPSATGEQQIINIQSAASTDAIAKVTFNQTTDVLNIANFTNTGALVFGTGGSGTERMRIDASGNLLVGTTGVSGNGEKVRVNGRISVDGTGIHFAGATIFGGANAMGLRWSGPDIIGTVDNVVYAVLGTTSDYRLKTDFQQLSSCLDKIKKLKPLTYVCKDFDGTIKDERRTGFIAHEIQEVFPDLATLHKDAKDEQGNPQYQSVNYAGLAPYLVKAMQEQQAIIEKLEARLAALEAK